MRLEPHTVVDRYRVEALLGEGGMAAVYRVRHHQLDTLFALKVLKTVNADIRDRLLQEGRVQAALRHPNIVSVTDVVVVDGTPGLVMEFVEGASLDTLLAEGRLNLRQADHLARGILAGAAAAHEEGLIHRDLKPANILLALDRRDQFVPKITDFGLAKVLGEAPGVEATRQGIGFGTPSFMAPEQIRNAAAVDHRADIFSLGAILYEMVTGRRCFGGTDVLDVLNRVAGCEYVPIVTYAPDLPQHMVDAITGALQIRPEDRWSDVRSLLAHWKQEESDFDMPFGLETSQRMRVLGAGVSLQGMPSADGPTALRNGNTPPSPSERFVRASEVETVDLPETAPPPRPRERPSRAGLWVGLGFSTAAFSAVAGTVLAALLLLGLWWTQQPAALPVAPLPHSIPGPVAQLVPDRRLPQTPPPDRSTSLPTAPPARLDHPIPPPSPAPAVAATAPAPRPQVEPVSPAPAVVPVEAPRYGSVYVSGDMTSAWLVSDDGQRRDYGARVIPGTYRVGALFSDGSRALSSFAFPLAPGDIVHLECDKAFVECRRP